MLFQSFDFAVFLPIALLLYWPLRHRVRVQNAFIVVASCVFYGWSNWHFLLPMTASVVMAYAAALMVGGKEPSAGTAFVTALAVTLELSLLAYFKYYNFFIDAFNGGLSVFGSPVHLATLRLLIPVGVSFYVFRAISYVVDVSRDTITVERSFVNVVAFIAFFPYLLAGPVERGQDFMPQLHRERTVDSRDLAEAWHLILWGLFKKIVIADSLASRVDYVFANYTDLTGSVLAVGVLYFTLQLYADFSGYSDIAVGVAKLFGFTITQNFALPFFARDIADFWRRWHISLYHWLNEYIYTPVVLTLRDWGMWGVSLALLLTFTLSGLWHGANWTFVVWGALHGAYLVTLVLWRKWRGRRRTVAKPAGAVSAKDVALMLFTFSSVVLANIFFRSDTIRDALSYLRHLVSPSFFYAPNFNLTSVAWVAVLPAFEWVQRRRKHPLDIGDWHYTVRYPIYAVLCVAIFVSIQLVDTRMYLYFKF